MNKWEKRKGGKTKQLASLLIAFNSVKKGKGHLKKVLT